MNYQYAAVPTVGFSNNQGQVFMPQGVPPPPGGVAMSK